MHRTLPWIVFVVLFVVGPHIPNCEARQAPSASASAGSQGREGRPGTPAPQSRLDPSEFIRIFEDVGDKRILLYDPAQPELTSRKFKADAGSTLIIEPLLAQVPAETAINNLYMSATLAGDKAVALPVVGYSEIGTAKESAESQKAVSFQTLGDIRENVSTIYWTSREILDGYYDGCFVRITTSPFPTECATVKSGTDPKTNNQAAIALFSVRRPEIESIVSFLSDG